MLCFFRSLIDFDLIEGHLISGQIRFRSGQVSMIVLKNQIGSNLNPNESNGFLESDRILPPIATNSYYIVMFDLCDIKWPHNVL
jgi:hypothetical protein